MKKTLLCIATTTLCLCLAGCGSTTDSSISQLNSQLDSTANTITSTSIVNPTDIALSYNTTNDDDFLYSTSKSTQQSLIDEEYYKSDILNKTAHLKNRLNQNLQLSKNQATALKDLTNSLNRYTNSVESSKSEMSTVAKSISKLKKDASKNYDKLNSRLNRLECNSNVRSAYYQNILNTLDQIDNCIDLAQNDTLSSNSSSKNTNSTKEQNRQTTTQSTENDSENNNSQPEQQNKPHKRFRFTHNIDTYGPTRRNIDTMDYSSRYYNRGMLNNPTANPYYANGYYNNYASYPKMPTPAGSYANFYNSNNFNRATTPYYLNQQTSIPTTAQNQTNDPTNTSSTKLNEIEEKEEIRTTSTKPIKLNKFDLRKIDNSSTKFNEDLIDENIIAH